MSKANVNFCTAFYANAFKLWPKTLGSKPTEGMLQSIHYLGAELGKQHLTIALTLRPGGVTSAQILQAAALLDVNGAGKPQNNKRKGFITDGLLREIVCPPVGSLKVYACEVTPKGQKRIDTRLKAAEALHAKGNEVEKPVKKAGKAAGAVKVVDAGNTAPTAQNTPVTAPSPAMAVLSETVEYPAAEMFGPFQPAASE